MKTKPPRDRRKFANEWDEIEYLRDKLLYWLHGRAAAEKARPFADRLAQLLPKADPNREAILGEECWSLVCEAKGDLPDAIQHRANEICLIRRLHEISRNAPYEAFALQGYGHDILRDHLVLLARLYHAARQPDRALATLGEAKRVCQQHGIAFGADDLMQECQKEKQATANGRPGNGRGQRRAKVASHRSE
jgi:hypothetical protein